MTTLTFASRAPQAKLKLHVTPAYNERPLRVLCATDLWARSDFAVQRALTLADASEAQSLLLHVVDGDAPLRIVGRRAGHAHSALAWRVRQWRRLGTPPAISVRVGNPRRGMIADVAQDWRADLIVLGGYRPRAADWLLGTTAERLAAAVNCAVLVVNREPTTAYSRISLATDSLDFAPSLTRIVSDLSIGHDVQPEHRTVVYGGVGPGPRRSGADDLHTASFDFAAQALINADSDLIVTQLDRRPAVTRVLGRNMASTLVRGAPCDVLIVPRGLTRTLMSADGRHGGLLRAAA